MPITRHQDVSFLEPMRVRRIFLSPRDVGLFAAMLGVIAGLTAPKRARAEPTSAPAAAPGVAPSPSVSPAPAAPPDASAQMPNPTPPELPAQPSAPNVTAASPEPLFYDLLTFYKDNYFITGFSKSVESKFQFSAKFDLWPNRGAHAVYFAYSQKSLWNIYLSSAPFAESNYNPEIFYTFFHHEGRYHPPPGCGFFHERAGAEHESDGLDGPMSRGWNRIYIESRYACHAPDGLFATATLKVWAPPFFDSDNPDIVNYLGYGELSLDVGGDRGDGWLDQWDFTVTGRKGTSASIGVGSIQVDGRWRPPNGSFWRFTPFLYAQMFTGYGESLLSYDRPLTAFRIGIGLSDISTRSR